MSQVGRAANNIYETVAKKGLIVLVIHFHLGDEFDNVTTEPRCFLLHEGTSWARIAESLRFGLAPTETRDSIYLLLNTFESDVPLGTEPRYVFPYDVQSDECEPYRYLRVEDAGIIKTPGVVSCLTLTARKYLPDMQGPSPYFMNTASCKESGRASDRFNDST